MYQDLLQEYLGTFDEQERINMRIVSHTMHLEEFANWLDEREAAGQSEDCLVCKGKGFHITGSGHWPCRACGGSGKVKPKSAP